MGRISHDFYVTPDPLAEAALRTIAPLIAGRGALEVVDAGCGEGAWGRAWRKLYGADHHVTGVEIARDRKVDYAPYDDVLFGDFRRYNNCADVIIGNPPFKHADSFTRNALELTAPGGIVLYLLNLSFLCGADRYRRLWRKHPVTEVHAIPARPGFIPEMSGFWDMAIYTWHSGPRQPLQWLDWLDPSPAMRELVGD